MPHQLHFEFILWWDKPDSSPKTCQAKLIIVEIQFFVETIKKREQHITVTIYKPADQTGPVVKEKK